MLFTILQRVQIAFFGGVLFLSSCLLMPDYGDACSTSEPSIILDPGHSPRKPGAKSCSGTYEYVYNNKLAEVVARYLSVLSLDVAVTKKPDAEFSLVDRASLSSGKTLFISLHHDSAQPQFIRRVNGNPCSEKAEGFSLFVSSKNAYFQESLAAAKVLGASLRVSGLHPSTHHGEPIPGENRKLLDEYCGVYLFDDLIVLKNAKSPAILLEAGVIVNPVDDARVKTLEHQQKIAEAVAKALMSVGVE